MGYFDLVNLLENLFLIENCYFFSILLFIYRYVAPFEFNLVLKNVFHQQWVAPIKYSVAGNESHIWLRHWRAKYILWALPFWIHWSLHVIIWIFIYLSEILFHKMFVFYRFHKNAIILIDLDLLGENVCISIVGILIIIDFISIIFDSFASLLMICIIFRSRLLNLIVGIYIDFVNVKRRLVCDTQDFLLGFVIVRSNT